LEKITSQSKIYPNFFGTHDIVGMSKKRLLKILCRDIAFGITAPFCADYFFFIVFERNILCILEICLNGELASFFIGLSDYVNITERDRSIEFSFSVHQIDQ